MCGYHAARAALRDAFINRPLTAAGAGSRAADEPKVLTLDQSRARIITIKRINPSPRTDTSPSRCYRARQGREPIRRRMRMIKRIVFRMVGSRR